MADQEINEAVARKLGWTPLGDAEPELHARHKWATPHFVKDGYMQPPPDYCRSIAAAWEIVEHLKKEPDISVEIYIDDEGATCLISEWAGNETTLSDEHADIAPMAICLAFLKVDLTK